MRFIRTMPPSDKLIAGILALCVLIAALAGLAALARSFQVAVPAYGGTIHEGVVGAPRFVNPLLASTDTDRDLVALTYAGLMGRDASGALVPVLAQSYKVSPDGTQYQFTLRSDATFSDGTPVTADDVVFTVQKAQDPGLKSPQLSTWANVRVEKVDARTVQFTLPKAYPLFLEDATLGILPKHLWQDVPNEQFPFSPYTTNPVGAGPFEVSSVSTDKNGGITGYSLTAFKGYATGRPYLSGVKFTVYPDDASLQSALKSGSVTSAYGVVQDGAKSVPYARVFGVFFNPDQDAALKDVDVRKALSLAIDRQAIVKGELGGYGMAINGPLPRVPGVTLMPLPDESTREDDAKAALENAGYTYDDSQKLWTDKKGAPLAVTLQTSNVPELKAVVAAVQKDWQALGVQVTVQYSDPSDLTQNVIRPRAYGALLFGEVVGTDPDLYAFWDTNERAAPGLNIADYSDTSVDALLEQARSETGETKTDALTQLEAKIAADYPAAFLYAPDFVYVTPPGVSGINYAEVSAPSDRFDGIATWYRYTDHVWPIFAHRGQ